MKIDLTDLTDYKLAKIEERVVRNRNEEIKRKTERYEGNCAAFSLVIWLIICISMAYTLNLEITEEDKNISFVLLFLLCGPIVILLGTLIGRAIGEKRSKFTDINDYNECKKAAMVQNIVEDYDLDEASFLLTKLYDSSQLESNFFIKINKFLGKENKKFQDYLNTLNEKELELLAAPYKEDIVNKIKSIVDAYFKRKEQKDQDSLNFYKKSKEFLYSNMPKNVAIN
jgi:hypothetical protein